MVVLSIARKKVSRNVKKNNKNTQSIHLPKKYIHAELFRFVDFPKFRTSNQRCSVKRYPKKVRKITRKQRCKYYSFASHHEQENKKPPVKLNFRRSQLKNK